ncbi:MAG TPA: flagellar basal body-associated FliL family protein [Steroidobacteraceae bacterium]|jgi:flagellar FliL protein|nr:flagellar basal body-associated FliL family protein [Steroidobacteraceae bacterium]
MAEIPVLEAAPGQAGAPPRKKPKLLVLIIAAVVVLAGAGGGAWYFMSGHKAKSPEAAKKAEEALKGPPIYVALDPPFVVNFEAEQLVRFLQVTVQVMSRDPATVEEIKANDPVVRNDLLLLLGNQHYQTVSTREGKEKLRQQALDVVKHVVTSAGGKPEHVEAVYFTSFVMQ